MIGAAAVLGVAIYGARVMMQASECGIGKRFAKYVAAFVACAGLLAWVVFVAREIWK